MERHFEMAFGSIGYDLRKGSGSSLAQGIRSLLSSRARQKSRHQRIGRRGNGVDRPAAEVERRNIGRQFREADFSIKPRRRPTDSRRVQNRFIQREKSHA